MVFVWGWRYRYVHPSKRMWMPEEVRCLPPSLNAFFLPEAHLRLGAVWSTSSQEPPDTAPISVLRASAAMPGLQLAFRPHAVFSGKQTQ